MAAAPAAKRLRAAAVGASSAAPASILAASASSPAADVPHEVQAQDLAGCMACVHACFVDCLAFDVLAPDELEGQLWQQASAWMKKADEDAISTVEALSGRWWKIASSFQGKVAWKQERPDDEEVFLTFYPGVGWYVTQGAVLQPDESNVLAWGKGSGAGSEWPAKLHVPYWSRAACPLVRFSCECKASCLPPDLHHSSARLCRCHGSADSG